MREEDEFESLAMRFERRLKGALREMQSSHSFPSRCRSNSSSNAFTLESKGGGEDEEEEDEEEEEDGEKEEEEKKRMEEARREIIEKSSPEGLFGRTTNASNND